MSGRRGFQLGGVSAFACLPGGALLVAASDRLSHALLAAVALAWVYCLSCVAAFYGGRFFPARGGRVLFAFISSFAAAMYLLALSLALPLAALQVFFAVSLVCVLCAASGIQNRLSGLSLSGVLRLSLQESLAAGLLVILIAVIREPVGFGSISLPGGAGGIIVFYPFGSDPGFNLRLLSASSGALLLIGYLLGVYRYMGAKQVEEKQNDGI